MKVVKKITIGAPFVALEGIKIQANAQDFSEVHLNAQVLQIQTTKTTLNFFPCHFDSIFSV